MALSFPGGYGRPPFFHITNQQIFLPVAPDSNKDYERLKKNASGSIITKEVYMDNHSDIISTLVGGAMLLLVLFTGFVFIASWIFS